MYASIRPLLNQVRVTDDSQPIDERVLIRYQALVEGRQALAILSRMPSRLSEKHIVDIVSMIAPRRAAQKQGQLVELQTLFAASVERAQDIKSRLGTVQATYEKRKASRRRKRPPSPASDPEKEGRGFQSRVGAMLKKRPKRKARKPRKKSKPRKPRKKQGAKKEVVKPEPVLEPKKIIDVPPSPKIKKQKKTAGNFPDVVVRRRRRKKYLN